jgi:paraquat-inducible protein B
MEKTDRLISKLNTSTRPQVEATLTGFQTTLDDLRRSIGSDSDVNHDARLALAELAEAAKSIKVLTDYLSNHPESLLQGKDNPE